VPDWISSPRHAARWWSGCFYEDGPDAMVAPGGERAVYGWNSLGFGEGVVTQHGDAHSAEPWPGASALLQPLPGKALLASYERRGQQAIARLALSPVNTSKRVGMKSPLLTQSFSTA
jgi:hypothetical protein